MEFRQEYTDHILGVVRTMPGTHTREGLIRETRAYGLDNLSEDPGLAVSRSFIDCLISDSKIEMRNPGGNLKYARAYIPGQKIKGQERPARSFLKAERLA